MHPLASPQPQQLIVSHDHADFDAIAAQVAATKLHPAATMALAPAVGRDVRVYLALHRDRFAFVPFERLDLSRVARLILVDTRSAARLRHIAPLLARVRDTSVEIWVYDHHPAREDDVRGDFEVIERVGSASTLLVERIQERRIPLDAVEATLLSLGIHADTGSLTYPNSTSRDARALAHLLDAGASLEAQNRYLHTPFKLAQRRTMAALLQTGELHELGGFHVIVASVDLPMARSSGLDEVTTRAFESLGCHALFGLFHVRGRDVQIIARARSAGIDVGQVLARLGGGGHRSAAAASLKGMALVDARQGLLDELAKLTPRARRAKDIMHSPPHTISVDAPVSELRGRLAAWRETGVCVTRDGSLVAVVSQRDLERAGNRDRSVKSYMSQRLVTIDAEAPLEEVLAMMEGEDVGHLPVLRDKRLIGVVTRASLLSAVYRV